MPVVLRQLAVRATADHGAKATSFLTAKTGRKCLTLYAFDMAPLHV